MSIPTSKSSKELGFGEERLSKKKEATGGYIFDHHVRILLKESMLMIFYTNIVLFFAGEVAVSMPYPLMNFQLVVLVQYTQSTGRELRVGTSMKARMVRRALCLCTAIGTFKLRRLSIYILHHSVLVLRLSTSKL